MHNLKIYIDVETTLLEDVTDRDKDVFEYYVTIEIIRVCLYYDIKIIGCEAHGPNKK